MEISTTAVSNKSKKELREQLLDIRNQLDSFDYDDKDALPKIEQLRARQDVLIAQLENVRSLEINDETLEDVEEKDMALKPLTKREKIDLGKGIKALKQTTGASLKVRAAFTAIGNDSLLIPSHESNVIAPYPFAVRSGILDLVRIVRFTNGDSYALPLQKSVGMADYTDEGQDYTDVETSFDMIRILRAKITGYSETSKEFERYPAAQYAQLVVGNIEVSIMRKLDHEIYLGDGQGVHLTGIFSTATAGNKLSDLVYTDITIEKIDETTTDNVQIDFGGSIAIEPKLAYVINKRSMKNFAAIRGVDMTRAYNIVYAPNGMSATVNGNLFVFTDTIKAFDDAAVGEFVMAYADWNDYYLTLFQDGLDLESSIHFKFKQGITAHRGDTFAGGNFAGYKGLVRVKKGAPTAEAVANSRGSLAGKE